MQFINCFYIPHRYLIIHQRLYSPLLGPGFLFSFVIFFTETVGLFGREISPPQGHYLHTGQHEHKINAHTNIHALSGTRTHDPNIRAGEDISCLRPRGHCGRHIKTSLQVNVPGYHMEAGGDCAIVEKRNKKRRIQMNSSHDCFICVAASLLLLTGNKTVTAILLRHLRIISLESRMQQGIN
jgi:hypothetical protein